MNFLKLSFCLRGRGREKEKERERDFSHLLIYSPDAPSDKGSTGDEDRNQKQRFHSRSPTGVTETELLKPLLLPHCVYVSKNLSNEPEVDMELRAGPGRRQEPEIPSSFLTWVQGPK